MVSAIALRPLARLARPVKALVRPFPRLNAAMWNAQYKLGIWDYLDVADGAQALMLVEEHAPDAKVLDLGCGTSANLPLAQARYRHYHGVDISATAVERARALGRPNTSFEVADVLSYDTSDRYDVILLREVLYYLPAEQIPTFLRRLPGLLERDGKIIIQIWDARERGELADAVRRCGIPVLLERPTTPNGTSGGVFIVLAPHLRA